MFQFLLVFILLAPILFGALDAASSRKRWFSIVGSSLALLSIGKLWLSGQVVRISIPILLPGLGISFGSSPVGLLLAGVTALVWLAASIFSLRYLAEDQHCSRFYLLFGLSVAGATACFLAGDFLGLLLGFEVMSLASYGLVAHNPGQKAQKAGKLYLYLGVAGGILLAVALAILWHHAGSLDYSQLGQLPLGLAVLFSLGFAIKAGAFPLHFWLPEAHPVAPATGSALLSGILIKTGAFGLLRIASLTANGRIYGLAMIIIALITMSVGVLLALIQADAKRLLAYHSVSQMGYILLGIGLWALGNSTLGFGGAVFHMVNHALFKSALFLICGSALLACQTVDLYQLGSLRKAFGLLTPMLLIPAFGIAGVPGFNGYVSKTLLHDALLQANLPASLLAIADKIFVLVAFGTVCSFIKFAWYIFFADRKCAVPLVRASKAEVLGVGVLILPILGLGLFPQPVLKMIASELRLVGVSWPIQLGLLSSHALQGTLQVLLGGLLLYLICHYTGLFHLHLPKKLSLLAGIKGLYRSISARGSQVVDVRKRLTASLHNWHSANLQGFKQSLKALDYRPGTSTFGRALSVTNLNFNVYVVMGLLSVLLAIYPLLVLR